MKKIFILLVMFLCTTMAFSQNYKDVVYLKNGSVIKGLIIEQVPNVSIKIQTNDGCLFVYKISEIEKITKEIISEETKGYDPTSISRTKFRFFLESGYTFGKDDGGRLELLTSMGSLVNKYIYLGAGLGLNYYTDGNSTLLPIYANIRGYIPTGSIILPYIDLKPGYSIGLSDSNSKGFYINTTVGIQIHNFTVGIGYASQSISYDEDYHHYSDSNGGFTLKVGVVF